MWNIELSAGKESKRDKHRVRMARARGLLLCDNGCNYKALRYRQIASMVIEEGGEARTISLCLCFNEKLVQHR